MKETSRQQEETDSKVEDNKRNIDKLRNLLEATRREMRTQASMVDGDHESQWVVLDYGIMMVHAFHPEKRDLYALEDLWGDAKKVDWQALAEK